MLSLVLRENANNTSLAYDTLHQGLATSYYKAYNNR